MTQTIKNTNIGTISSGLQTPTNRQILTLVTPPESPSKNQKSVDVNGRKRQRTVKACEDESLFLPMLNDCDSPVCFPRYRRSAQTDEICTRPPASPTVVPLPSHFDDDYDDKSPSIFSLAPRYQGERIIDMSEVTSNKRFRLTPSTKSIFLPLDL
ncbi:unnamed protein product [Cylindrotheca closterium]|uniref:Uncharacterized protein n=1 Tax=Cylindrotheca closterium TaxID=2856 RepID=A0AAD2FI89_9STRA|nr:unnamed protein product [Cylindrotheca closterium]